MDRKTFDDYDSLIKAQANEAMSKINDFANALDYGNTAESRGLAKEMLQDYAYDCITTYGDKGADGCERGLCIALYVEYGCERRIPSGRFCGRRRRLAVSLRPCVAYG